MVDEERWIVWDEGDSVIYRVNHDAQLHDEAKALTSCITSPRSGVLKLDTDGTGALLIFEWLSREGGSFSVGGRWSRWRALLPCLCRALARRLTRQRLHCPAPLECCWLPSFTGCWQHLALRNTTGGMVLAWVIVLVIAQVVFSAKGFDLQVWWRECTVVIVGELLFVVLFQVGQSCGRAEAFRH
jgi:hypothetical protein